jgi:hypothetical protein
MKSIALLVIILSFAVIFASAKNVITPFGIRPEQCVIEVDSETTISEGDGVLLIHRPGALVAEEFVVPPECANDIEDIHKKLIQRKRVPNPSPEIDINGWLDYGGWYPPQADSNLNSFTVSQVVPGTPGTPAGGQVLFYFIGMQDNDDSAVNIIQPVLTWGNGYNQWYLKSWACCPSNITVSSKALFGLNDGDTFTGTINRKSPSTWTITSTFNGKSTTLNAQVGDYNYNWADVTLEVYNVDSCSDFAPDKAYFNQLTLKDVQGDLLTPQWTFTGPTDCGGSIVQVSSTSVYIEHTP